MAIKNAFKPVLTTVTQVYTAPAGGAQITMIQVTNIDGTNDADVSVYYADSSESGAAAYLCWNTPVKAKEAISVIAGGLILEAGDTIRATASAAGDLHIIVCAIEPGV